jgi:hypothetical protein
LFNNITINSLTPNLNPLPSHPQCPPFHIMVKGTMIKEISITETEEIVTEIETKEEVIEEVVQGQEIEIGGLDRDQEIDQETEIADEIAIAETEIETETVTADVEDRVRDHVIEIAIVVNEIVIEIVQEIAVIELQKVMKKLEMCLPIIQL